MNATTYLQNKLQDSGTYTLQDNDRTRIKSDGIEGYVFAKLTNKRFRKWAMDELAINQAKTAIHLNISENKPIQFRYPFGGYKLWRMPGAPEVDWAEFFSVAYYSQYLAPVAAAYQPGVELIFASDDVIIERMDNIPAADTDAYFVSFQRLLQQFEKYLPANLKISIQRIGDLYPDKDQMEDELEQNIGQTKVAYQTMDPARVAKMTASSALNIKPNGLQDLTNLSPEEFKAIIDMGPIYHDAYCALPRRKEFNRGEDKIVLFTTVIPNAIALGTTKASITKFWTGYGMLEKTATGFKDIIVSPQQLLSLTTSNTVVTDESCDLIDLKNFHTIKIRSAL